MNDMILFLLKKKINKIIHIYAIDPFQVLHASYRHDQCLVWLITVGKL